MQVLCFPLHNILSRNSLFMCAAFRRVGRSVHISDASEKWRSGEAEKLVRKMFTNCKTFYNVYPNCNTQKTILPRAISGEEIKSRPEFGL